MTSPGRKVVRVPPPAWSRRLAAALAWLGLALLVASTIGAGTARVSWIGELLCSLRLYIGLAGVPVAAALFILRRRIPGACAALLVAYHVLPVIHLYTAHRPALGPVAGGLELTVVGANLNYTRSDGVRFLGFVRERQPDLLAAFEVTEFWSGLLDDLADLYPHRVTYERREGEPFAVALLSRHPFTREDVRDEAAPRPYLDVTVSVEGTEVQVLVLHPPQPEGPGRKGARDALLARVANTTEWCERAVVVGDLNATLYSPAYTDFLSDCELVDTRCGSGYRPSWSPPLLPGYWLDLDHVLVRGPFTVVERERGPDIGSDHLPTLAVLLTSRE